MSEPLLRGDQKPLSKVLTQSRIGRQRETQCECTASRDDGNRCGRDFSQIFSEDGWAPRFCPTCSDVVDKLRRERHRRDAEHHEQLAAQEAARAHAARLAVLNVPLLYRDATLDNFRLHGASSDQDRQARVIQLARRYLAGWSDRQNPNNVGDFPTIAIFRGDTGTGKGHVCWAIAKHVALEEHGRVVFRTLADSILDLREPWQRKAYDGPSERERLAHYREADLLIVDEVSSHNVRGEPAPELYQLIAERETWLRPTILTTNESPEGLARLLGAAVESRAAGYRGLWNFGAADYRVERAQRKSA